MEIERKMTREEILRFRKNFKDGEKLIIKLRHYNEGGVWKEREQLVRVNGVYPFILGLSYKVNGCKFFTTVKISDLATGAVEWRRADDVHEQE